MASLSFLRHLIECDGCKVTFGDQQGFDSLTEARALAYAAGWRFPHMVDAKGKATKRTSDVCPDCLSTWTAEQFGKTGQRQRVLTVTEAAKLR
jgi:hypothetical protein